MLAIPYFFPETGALRNFKKNRPATPHNFEQEKTKNAPKEMRVFKHLERSRQLIMRLVIQPPSPPPSKKGLRLHWKDSFWYKLFSHLMHPENLKPK